MKERVRSSPGRIVFPEGDDPRVVEAVVRLGAEGLIGEAILLGDRELIARRLGDFGSPGGISVRDIHSFRGDARYRNEYRIARSLSVLEGEALDLALGNPVAIGALMVRTGEAECFIGGLRTSSAEIISMGIGIIKADRRVGVVTSFCMVITGNESLGEKGILVIADPVVNPDPTVGVLCKIAEAAARFARRFLNIQPRIAFLSYSTKGSGSGRSVDKMRIAAERAHARLPELVIDGELQLDAAISPEVALRKAPAGPLGGRANILIFPNLDSANIASKLLQFFGGAALVGPIIFGLNKPYNDISRSATVDDICNLAVVTQLQV